MVDDSRNGSILAGKRSSPWPLFILMYNQKGAHMHAQPDSLSTTYARILENHH